MNVEGSFGQWLRQRRKALDLTQVELADQVGCSVMMIRKIEEGVRLPSKQIAERIAEVLIVSPDERGIFVAFARQAVTNVPGQPGPAKSRPIHELPPQPTLFVGRVHELARIAECVADPNCRLLTLIGPGGVGKTRLAIEAARRNVEDTAVLSFRHGVFFVALQPLTSPDFIVPGVAEVVGLLFHPGEEPKQQLLEFLRQEVAAACAGQLRAPVGRNWVGRGYSSAFARGQNPGYLPRTAQSA